jgi:hypothetical protein
MQSLIVTISVARAYPGAYELFKRSRHPMANDAAVEDAHIATAIHIHAITVCINSQIVDSQIIDAGGQNPEVSAMQDRKIAQQNVATIFQCDGIVADAWCLGN